MTAEEQRLQADRDRQAYWRRWGPYLSERQWGTVREDYSADGAAWEHFPHEQARSRAYRWGEDGIAGISDNHQRLCFAIALWNGADPILKERLFGLTGPEGNHGEDVKEYYFYLDNTPSHAYMKYFYKYPHAAFPYTQLVQENQRRGYREPEFELVDTGIFDDDRYFDIYIEYAKATDEDILIQITAINRGAERQTLHLLPTLWFRNTWSWDLDSPKPQLQQLHSGDLHSVIAADSSTLGDRYLYCQSTALLFTENETNSDRLFGTPNSSPYVKDGINDYIVHGRTEAVNPQQLGTKVAADYELTLDAHQAQTIQLRLTNRDDLAAPFAEFADIFALRQQEADEFYQRITPNRLSDDARQIQRQAFAGLLWTKQYYHYVVEDWLQGDPTQPPPQRHHPRNSAWIHVFNDDIISMPDKWEFPWFAAWDLAFHCIPLATLDPDFAKRQLDRLTREWYMHPNGQIPAYEWHFGDVNPPVHAWATWRVYQIEQEVYGRSDPAFLERVFQKLLLNFTWWVNQKDHNGNNIFQGGFLGLDNIGIFYDVLHLPDGRHHHLKVRSMVGLVPLFATAILESATLDRLPDFQRRFEWFIANRPNLHRNLAALSAPGAQARRLLAIVNPIDRLPHILYRLLDETEFLSPYGVRSLSKIHAQQPYTFSEGGQLHTIAYEPAESTTGMFGGNSNWRGPIWLQMNFLIIESLQQFHTYLGDEFTVECPTGSGQWLTLAEVATELSHRSIAIFEQNAAGNRPVHDGNRLFQTDPHWRDLLLFYEHFNGDNGAGLGANHQTGWTGLVATLIRDCSERSPISQPEYPQPISSIVDR
ncbi:MGH1-like glycoside hydrolase domain-containing protein [Chamaesiphon polymorphus]|uniref:Uncharacterized protein n=1 Tax=Chamaesiphon polymorphus CCALA 037 TaxID=2107692 RepID=A0A2T1GH62_9CYAN|nr:hypothetical protein [Chamaesiphon polymorphus]PSB57030.1 hypothetical protein C7B77_09850 [Chamaesiphon polymorphus CCALA 037]